MTTPADVPERAVRPSLRALYLVPLMLACGYQALLLLLFSGGTAAYFAWTVRSPLTAATLGASYASGVALFAVGLRLRRWVDVRIVAYTSLAQLVLMLGVAVLHHDRLHLTEGEIGGFLGAWGFVAVHAVMPLVGLALLAVQSRAPGANPPRTGPADLFTGVPIAWVALVGCGLGAAMLAVPGALRGVWPWPVTDLDLRALGVWTLTFGLGSLWALREGDPERMRAGAAGYTAVGAFSLVAVVTHPGAMDWGSVLAWLYVLGMLGLVGMGLVGLALAGPAERWPGNGSVTMGA
jgi:hypothetical protein